MKIHTVLMYLLFFGWSSGPLCAQKLRMGFLAGPNYSFAHYDFPAKVIAPNPNALASTWSSTAQPGFFFGFDVQYDLEARLFATTGLVLNGHNFKATRETRYGDGRFYERERNQFSVYELQIPLLLNYRLGKFSAGAGGFVASAFGGTFNHQQDFGNGRESSTQIALRFSNADEENTDFRPFNAGLRAEGAFGVKRWRFAAHFDLGLMALQPAQSSRDFEVQTFVLRRSTLGFSVLYQPWPR